MNLLLAVAFFVQDKTAEQLIEQLSSDSVEERGQAREQLKRMGKSAIPALEKAAKGNDAEVIQSARDILEYIRTAPAAEAFGKIEETLRKAKTLRVVFKGEESTKGGKTVSAGTALTKEGNKVRVSHSQGAAGRELTTKIISDGATLAMPLGEHDPDKRKPPRNLSKLIASALARIGIGEAFMCIRHVSLDDHPGGEEPAPEEIWKISDLQEGPDEDGLKTLLYKVKPIKRDIPLQAKLWYEARTFKLKRRVLTFESGEVHWTDTEVYEEIVLDADVPDTTFEFTEGELAQMDMKVYQAKIMIGALSEVLDKYQEDTSTYPATEKGLEALLRSPKDVKGWKGPYLEVLEIPKDPWGNAFSYRFPGARDPKNFDLISAGPDGKLGTKDDVFLVRPKPSDKK